MTVSHKIKENFLKLLGILFIIFIIIYSYFDYDFNKTKINPLESTARFGFVNGSYVDPIQEHPVSNDFISVDNSLGRFETINNIDGRFLVLEEKMGSGTGALLIDEVWYFIGINGEKIKEVLRYPKEGYVSGWGMTFDRKFSSSYAKEENVNPAVIVKFNASYTNSNIIELGVPDSDELSELFSISRQAIYIWDHENSIFNLDSGRSQISIEQIDGLYNDGNDEFLKHNYADLKKFAQDRNPAKQQWIKAFLDTCKDGPQKTELIKSI